MSFFKNLFKDDYTSEDEYYDDGQEIDQQQDFAKNEQYKNAKVMSLVGSQKNSNETKKIMLFEPRVYSDVKQIATRLLSGEATLVNFQHMDDANAHRVIDFLTGVVFAVRGDIQRVGDSIFLCTPQDYTVEGTLSEFNRKSNFN
ncbi:cell division protein SepF [Ligilactobacillus ubinensis]|uniref:cell division protein SepF n=1 Tax=Ligilactobacillus ubinensis TaxID=2876789 RepID=UPI003CC59187